MAVTDNTNLTRAERFATELAKLSPRDWDVVAERYTKAKKQITESIEEIDGIGFDEQKRWFSALSAEQREDWRRQLKAIYDRARAWPRALPETSTVRSGKKLRVPADEATHRVVAALLAVDRAEANGAGEHLRTVFAPFQGFIDP